MENNEIKVSIIIPMYNCEMYIARCIESIKDQTLSDFEAIIVDDGSTDSSLSICKRAVGNDLRFKIVHKNNTGVSDTRNYGLSIAVGKTITFVDADDWINATYLQELVDAKNITGADIVCSGYCVSDGIREHTALKLASKNLSVNEALDGLSKYYFTSVWGKLFDKNTLKNVSFQTDLFYSEDTLFYTKAVLNSKLIAWIDVANYYYFDNSYGVMKNKNPQKYSTEFVARNIIVKLQKASKIDTYGVEYRLFDSAINVKLNLYRHNLYSAPYLEELNNVIRRYRKVYWKQFRSQIKAMTLNFPILFKLLNKIEGRKG